MIKIKVKENYVPFINFRLSMSGNEFALQVTRHGNYLYHRNTDDKNVS